MTSRWTRKHQTVSAAALSTSARPSPWWLRRAASAFSVFSPMRAREAACSWMISWRSTVSPVSTPRRAFRLWGMRNDDMAAMLAPSRRRASEACSRTSRILHVVEEPLLGDLAVLQRVDGHLVHGHALAAGLRRDLHREADHELVAVGEGA